MADKRIRTAATFSCKAHDYPHAPHRNQASSRPIPVRSSCNTSSRHTCQPPRSGSLLTRFRGEPNAFFARMRPIILSKISTSHQPISKTAHPVFQQDNRKIHRNTPPPQAVRHSSRIFFLAQNPNLTPPPRVEKRRYGRIFRKTHPHLRKSPRKFWHVRIFPLTLWLQKKDCSR